MLRLEAISAGYGAINALSGVSLEIKAGEIVCLIGGNGAGKTTLLRTICGEPQASSGAVFWRAEDITTLPTYAIMRRGIAHVPEGRRIFPRMTVVENLQLGAQFQPAENFPADVAKVFDLFPRLAERKNQMGGTLSGGEQQMLALGRALVSRPTLLLLDEPSLGLAPLVQQEIFAALRVLNRETGLTIFVVEQNAHLALATASRGYVLANGRIVLNDTSAALRADPAVQRAYLEGAIHA